MAINQDCVEQLTKGVLRDRCAGCKDCKKSMYDILYHITLGHKVIIYSDKSHISYAIEED